MKSSRDHNKDIRIPLLLTLEETQKIDMIARAMLGNPSDPPHGYRQFYLRGIISAAIERDFPLYVKGINSGD